MLTLDAKAPSQTAIAPSVPVITREYITASDVKSDRPSFRFLAVAINGKDASSLVVRPCDVVVAVASLSALNRAVKAAMGSEWCVSNWSLATDSF